MKTNTTLLMWVLLSLVCPVVTKAQRIVGNQEVINIPFTNGKSTEALLSLPDDYQSTSQAYPLIIFLHGWGESGTDINKLIKTALPQRIASGYKPSAISPKDGKLYKFIVVSPQAPDFSYQYGHVTAILANMIKNYRVDTARIYIAGVSAGGYGTWTCVADDVAFCKRLAAIAPISSMAVDGNRPNTINNAGKYGVGVWTICGMADDKWTIAVDYVNRVNAVQPQVPAKLTGLPGLGHTSAAWNQAFDPAFKVDNMNLYEWFLQFDRATTSTPQKPANKAPVANAGNDVTLQLPVALHTLDGSKSSDPDGSITSYSWKNLSKPSGFNLGSLLSGVTATLLNLIEGKYSFELSVTDDQGAVGKDTVNITVKGLLNNPNNGGSGSTPNCKGTRRELTPLVQNGSASIYMNGKNFKYSPGDTFVIKSQYNPWIGLDIESFHGTASCPIVIINEGDVKMAAGIKMTHCTYIKVTGSGTSSKYGFQVEGNGSGVALEVTGRSANIEIERVSVHKKTYGAWVKQEAHCADSLQYPNWWLDNISLHDCKFLNIGQDCLYFGSTSPNGQRTVACNGTTISPIPLRLSNIKIFNNIVDSCNRTGIQLSGADKGVNEIYNNIVTRCGYELNQTQGDGIALGGVTRAHVHDNYIRQTFKHGIFCIGAGFSRIENNDIDSSGMLGKIINTTAQPTGIFVDTRPAIPADSTKMYISNNVLGKNAVAKGEHIIVLNSNQTFAKGNIFCGNTVQETGKAAAVYTQPGISWSTCPANPVNEAPEAHAGGNHTITLPTNKIKLQGSGTDIDGKVVSYSWAKISGPNTFKIESSTSAVTEVTGLVVGTYVFELTVTDDKGATGKATATITVKDVANKAPTANAGTAQTITLPKNNVNLTGSGTDTDGTIASYSWAKTSGPAAFTIVTPKSAGTEVTGLVAGTYIFELTVTDNKGATGKASVTITVKDPANKTPTANAGTAQTITLPKNSVKLTGSGTDTDGTIASYSWAKTSGPATFTIVNPKSASTDVTGLVAGTYIFELTVTDNKGATGKASVTITVKDAANKAPTANAGTAQTITLPKNNVQLTGSGTDADGKIVSYAWAKSGGPASYTIVSRTSASTEVTGLVEGVYTFELTVTDDKGATGKATSTVTVKAAPNKLPTANAGTNQTITLPKNNVKLQGSGSDADGQIISYAWSKISGPSSYTIANSASAVTDVTGLVTGVYVFELMVWDDKRATARSTVTITVKDPENKLPTANAGPDQTITVSGNKVTLEGSGTDADGTITSYAWSKLSGPSSYNIVSKNNARTEVTGLVEGVYVFELRVTDNRNASAADWVTITVVDMGSSNKMPTANAGHDTVLVLPEDKVILDGTGSKPGSNPLESFEWVQKSGPSPANILAPNQIVTAAHNLQPGVYEFQLTVTDSKGATAKHTRKVEVVQAASAKHHELILYPVPAADWLNYRIFVEKDVKVAVTIVDVKGQIVSRFEQTYNSGDFNKSLSVHKLTRGTYFFIVSYDGHVEKRKFIKM